MNDIPAARDLASLLPLTLDPQDATEPSMSPTHRAS
ncbi:hypothetical protein ACIQXA_12760 [Streptomyces massasporeus]